LSSSLTTAYTTPIISGQYPTQVKLHLQRESGQGLVGIDIQPFLSQPGDSGGRHRFAEYAIHAPIGSS